VTGVRSIQKAAADFKMFRPELNAAFAYSDGAQSGGPPFDPEMMFKIVVIQTTNSLSDERAEFLINDHLSFMRFLGLALSDRVPDARTIWLFREKLAKAGAIGPLFERFDAALRQSGYIAMSGQIVDASLIAAPRQRNSNDEKKAIKEGRIPDEWKDKPGKLRQKDRDARWTVKFTKVKPREDGSMPPVDRMGLFIRTIGIARAATKIGLANLAYNMKRLLLLRRTAPA
jgi:IS5 family transposase